MYDQFIGPMFYVWPSKHDYVPPQSFLCAQDHPTKNIFVHTTQIFCVPKHFFWRQSSRQLKSKENSEIKPWRVRKSRKIFLGMAKVAVSHHVKNEGIKAMCKLWCHRMLQNLLWMATHIYSNQSFILYLFSGTCCRPKMAFVGGWGAKILRSSINIPFCVGVAQPIQKANRAKWCFGSLNGTELWLVLT